MHAFHAEPNAIKRDEIAARQLHALRQHHTEAWYREPIRSHPGHFANRLRLCKQKASRTVEQMQIDFRDELYELRPIQLHLGAASWAGRRFNVFQRVLKS